MAVSHCLWLMMVCWTMGEVYCQTFPCVSFMDQTLADHSYVDLSQVRRPAFPNGGGEGFSVSLTWPHVVVMLMVLIVETGISLMELDCLSMDLILIPMRIVYPRELTYAVAVMLIHQLLVSIAVIFQLMLSMMPLASQWETQSVWDCILTLEVCKKCTVVFSWKD